MPYEFRNLAIPYKQGATNSYHYETTIDTGEYLYNQPIYKCNLAWTQQGIFTYLEAGTYTISCYIKSPIVRNVTISIELDNNMIRLYASDEVKNNLATFGTQAVQVNTTDDNEWHRYSGQVEVTTSGYAMPRFFPRTDSNYYIFFSCLQLEAGSEMTLFEGYHSTWYVDDNGELKHTSAPEVPDKAFQLPLPKSVWRVDPRYEMGYPFNMLMPALGYLDVWALERENVLRVYDRTEPQTGFKSNGLAVLEPSSCISIHNEDRWEIDIKHPFDQWGKWKNLIVENVLKIDGQLFRIDRQSAYLDGAGGGMNAHASHITSDMADELILEADFDGGNGNRFIQCAMASKLPPFESDAYLPPYEFTYSSDINDIPADKFENVSLLAMLVGLDNSLLMRSGGELYRDNFYFSINRRMEGAKDNAFYLRYSLDMVEISQEIDYSDFCTTLYCYDNWGNMWGTSYAGTVSYAVHHQIMRAVKFNYSQFDGAMERLMADGQAYSEKCFTPKVTYKVKMAALKNDPKYAGFLELQNYNYGDSGTIYCPELDISTTQKIVEVEKNEITGEIISMTLGNMANSVVRPTYMGSTISSGHSVADKEFEALISSTIGSNIAALQRYPISKLQKYKISILQGGT